MAKKSKPSIKDIASTIPNAPEPAPAKEGDRTKNKRRTVLMSDELADRVRATADRYGVGINELQRYAIIHMLDMLDSGEHTLQGREVTVLKLDV